MKKILGLLVLTSLMLSIIPAVFAVSVGSGVGIDIETEDFPPIVWMCGDRTVYDDGTEPGRVSGDGTTLVERINNYAFEGEQIQWTILAMDKNGAEKILDVFATIGDVQGEGNDIEVNCQRIASPGPTIDPACNARISEEELTDFDSDTMQYYECTLSVETPDSMYGQYWVTVEAVDLDGLSGTMAENEYWFLNPVIALSIDGDLTFSEVRPGSSSYSETLLVGNDADDSSGVMMDMFISGTDFYDSSSSGAMCPNTNQLALGDGDSNCDLGINFGGASAFNENNGDAFCYFATNGAYSTLTDGRDDVEGYVGINYGIGFNDPAPFYALAATDATAYEIIQAGTSGTYAATAPYHTTNLLAPGAEMAVTFRLNLPEPCNGDFDTGDLFFWGEAI